MVRTRSSLMSARTRLRDDFDASGVRSLAKASKDAAQTGRLMTLGAIYDGASHGQAARIGDVTPQIVRDWMSASMHGARRV